MAAKLDEANVEKKFRGVTQTQESIQSLTLWVLHHKAQHEKIVELWFKVLKKSKMSHRLTMFYLCNEIAQTCKRKHAIVYKDAFKDVLKDAVLLVRDMDVRGAVERIFNIWGERGVYDKEFIEETVAILNNTKVRATINSKLLAEFKPKALMDMVTKMKRHDDDIELRTRQLSTLRLDASNVEAVKLLKDRMQGKEFCQQFEDSCTKLESFVVDLEKGIKDRTALIEMLEQSELFYDTQYGEAKIVANAYKNFGARVNNLRKKLEEHKKILSDPSSTVPSPSMDAPSPGNTPPLDNTEMIDMDLSDEEGRRLKSTGTTSLIPPGMMTADEFFTQLQSGEAPIVLPFQGATTSTAGAEAAPPPWSVPPPPPPTTSAQANSSNLVHLTQGNTTPVADEGSSTPVQDEKPDANAGMSNPIEFLTQLINQSNKNQTGVNASFFESLSSLSKQGSSKDKSETETGAAPDPISPTLDTSLTANPPAPPAWEPWDPQPETPTPSYVPDTRPTPTMPFGDPTVSTAQPYVTDTQPQNHPYAPDPQGHLYTESQPPTEPYTVNSQPPPQPYVSEVKPEGEGGYQPLPYGLEGQPPAPPLPYGQPPPPPPPNYVPDPTYAPPGSEHQPVFISAPPPPPVESPSTPGAPPPAHYPPSFYQESPVPQASTPDTPEGVPPFLPPNSSWGPMFSGQGFMPPSETPPPSQDSQAPYMPLGSVPPSSGPPPSSIQDSAGPTFTMPSGAPESPQFTMPPPSQPPQEPPPPFGLPPPGLPTDQPPPFGMTPSQGAQDALPFNMGQPPPEPPPFNMAQPQPDPPPYGLHQGAPENNQFNMGQGPPPDHPPFSTNQGPGQPFNMPPGQGPPDYRRPPPGPSEPYNIPHGNHGPPDGPPFCGPQDGPPFGGPQDGPPFGGPQDGPPFGGPQDGPPFGGPQDGPPFGGPQERPPFGGPQEGPPPFNMPPRPGPNQGMYDVPSSPQFNRNSPPRFNRRPSGPGDGSPFNRGPNEPHDDFGHNRGPAPHGHGHEGPPLRGILRHARQNNLTTIQTHEFDSPGSNSDQEGADVSSISTMISKGRIGMNHPPRPPSHPPTPPASGPIGAQPPPPRDEDDRQEFIEKLKRKKVFPPTIPAAPPKGILKNSSASSGGASNLRSLTEEKDSSANASQAMDNNFKNVEPNQPPTLPMIDPAPSLLEPQEQQQGNDMDVVLAESRPPLIGAPLSSGNDLEQAPMEIQERISNLAHRPPHFDHGERRQSFESRRNDHQFPPFGDRSGGGRMFTPREPRFSPRGPPHEHNFRDNYGRPFPKRFNSPRFENRFRHQFPRY